MSEGMPGLLPREPSQSPCLGDDDLRRYNGKCDPYRCYCSALGPACDRKRQVAGTLDGGKFVCPSCQVEKWRHEFGTHTRGRVTTTCKECRAEVERQRRERKQGYQAQYKREKRVERQRERQEAQR